MITYVIRDSPKNLDVFQSLLTASSYLAAGVESCTKISLYLYILQTIRLTLSEQRVGISVIQVLRCRKTTDKVVPVTSVVAGALDRGQMCHLVEHSGSLVLCMAGAAQSRQTGEKQRAVDHLAGGGVRISQDTVGAGAEDVGAVVSAAAAGGRTALAGDVVEDGGDRVLCRGGAGLEVLGHLCVVGLGVGRGRAGERSAVVECGDGRCAAGASAVGLNDCALGELLVVTADFTGLLAVDGGLDAVADEGDGAGNLGGVEVGIGEGTLGEDLEVTTSTQVVGYGDIERGLDSLASRKNLEGGLFKVLGADAETQTIEGDLLLSPEDLNLFNVGVVQEGTSLEELEILRSGVLDQSLDCGVAGELEFNVERRVIERETGDQSGQSSERKDLDLHDGR
jgi:hypothetical protein